jgi:hypothetical protein
MCLHDLSSLVECPRHEGGFDCTPFCNLCEGNQEYCVACTHKVCKYCYEAPIDPRFNYSCKHCVFTCPECKQECPYEVGNGDCEACDSCCIKHGDNHIDY